VLRKALASRQPGSRYIQTVPKRGYRFIEPVTEITEPDGGSSTSALSERGSHRVGEDHFVGRDRELMELAQAATTAAHGGALLIGVAGEPGIGKTTLVEEFTNRLRASRQDWLVARGRCLEQVAELDPYFCFFEALDALRESTDYVIPLMESYAPSWHARFDTLCRDSVPASALPNCLQQELDRFLRELARRHPLLLFFDDLHWADESTVAVLAFLVHRFVTDSARILIVAAYRPSIILAGLHPLLGVAPELRSRGAFGEIVVDALSRLEIERYLSKRFVHHHL
jgi:predicted ATPase